MQRLSPLDASFLHLESDSTHMHLGSVIVAEGPPPSYDEVLAHVGGKLSMVPRYRQRVRFVPFELGRPLWVDDPHFSLRYHIRFSALPAPGGEEQLRALVGRVMSQQLDRTKPLWEMWVVEGLEDDHWAIVSKLHHAMVDGISASDLMTVLFDPEPTEARPADEQWKAETQPGDARLLAEAVADRVVSPYEALRTARAALRRPRRLLQEAASAAKGLSSYAGIAAPPVRTSLSGSVGPHRSYAWGRTTLADIKAVRAALGGTVNDVVLAAVTGGYRALLLSRGEPVEGTVVRTLVPVSVARPGQDGGSGNRVSAMFADLPVGEPDPCSRLHSLTTQLRHLKDSRQAVAGERLVALSGFAPPSLLALGMRAAARVNQRNVTTVTTNVPGPQNQLYVFGRKALESFPYVPLGGGIRVGVAMFSYNGRLTIGVTGDADTAPDVAVLARGFETSMAELVKAAAG